MSTLALALDHFETLPHKPTDELTSTKIICSFINTSKVRVNLATNRQRRKSRTTVKVKIERHSVQTHPSGLFLWWHPSSSKPDFVNQHLPWPTLHGPNHPVEQRFVDSLYQLCHVGWELSTLNSVLLTCRLCIRECLWARLTVMGEEGVSLSALVESRLPHWLYLFASAFRAPRPLLGLILGHE